MAVNNDNLTLGEIKQQDAEMHAQIMKQCRDIKLDNYEQCHVAINELYGIALRRLGFMNVSPDMNIQEMKDGMSRHGIVDELDDGDGKDEFSAGIYFYKYGDLAYFISKPILVEPSVIAINTLPHYLVRTNVVCVH